jgi:outer membrane lipoprotein-sorting protein
VRIFRTMSTARLAALAITVVVVFGGTAVAVSARGGGGQRPPAKALAQALRDALRAGEPTGITARIKFTNKLFPAGALTGQAGSALMTGASGRLWANSSGGRLELQSDAGDTQVTWNDSKMTVYDASSNTAYVASLPSSSKKHGSGAATPTLQRITKFLAELGKHWTVSGATPTNVAGQPAYTVRISPSHDGGLLGSAELAWDAAHGTPLKVAIYAQGASAPALALEATDISFGAVPAADIDVAPPAGSKVVDVSAPTGNGGKDKGSPPVTGLAAVQAAAPFTVVAPDTLVGLPRQDVRLVGPADSKSVLVTYGQGLGAIVVVERAQETGTGRKPGGLLDALPAISLDGVTAHELATQLGTVLAWDRGGVSFILAGSVPSAAAEAAARALA